MADTSRSYLILGALYLCLGMLMGIVMGMRESFELAPVHAHINLVGFACHSLFGVIGKVFPGVARDSLAKAQFWIFTIGSPILMIGIAISILDLNPLVAIIGSLLTLLGSLLYLVMVLRSSAKA
jgi:hypothetical protein